MPISKILKLNVIFQLIFKILGTNEILPNGKINELAGQTLCLEEAITQSICTNLLFLICGFNADQLNTVSIVCYCPVMLVNVTYSKQ